MPLPPSRSSSSSSSSFSHQNCHTSWAHPPRFGGPQVFQALEFKARWVLEGPPEYHLGRAAHAMGRVPRSRFGARCMLSHGVLFQKQTMVRRSNRPKISQNHLTSGWMNIPEFKHVSNVSVFGVESSGFGGAEVWILVWTHERRPFDSVHRVNALEFNGRQKSRGADLYKNHE